MKVKDLIKLLEKYPQDYEVKGVGDWTITIEENPYEKQVIIELICIRHS